MMVMGKILFLLRYTWLRGLLKKFVLPSLLSFVYIIGQHAHMTVSKIKTRIEQRSRSEGEHASTMDTTHLDTSLPRGASLTECLVTQCARPITERDAQRCTQHILDWCGISFAAAQLPAARTIRSAMLQNSGTGPCSALAAGTAPPETAAFCNGALGPLLEMDDLHRASIMHAGNVVIPAALAAAQMSNASGRRLIEAVVMGYEVALRLGRMAARSGYTAWYNSAVCGVFGAAIAATHAAGGNDTAKRDALGQAGMQTSGLWQCRLEDTDSKAVATAHAARAGVTSALLALQGVRGAREILEARLGFFASYYPGLNGQVDLATAPDDWTLHEISFKPWSACRHVHPAVGLALQMRAYVPPETIDRVHIDTYQAALDFCDTPHPTTDHEARFSLQHCVAIALLTGDLRLADAEHEQRKDPTVAALREKMDVAQDADFTAGFPNQMGARLKVFDKEGAVHVRASTHAPGDPEQPLSEDALVAKFRANLRHAGIAEQGIETLRDAVSDLPNAADLTKLTAALEAGATQQFELQASGERHVRYQ